jgi:hypothetical protein
MSTGVKEDLVVASNQRVSIGDVPVDDLEEIDRVIRWIEPESIPGSIGWVNTAPDAARVIGGRQRHRYGEVVVRPSGVAGIERSFTSAVIAKSAAG